MCVKIKTLPKCVTISEYFQLNRPVVVYSTQPRHEKIGLSAANVLKTTLNVFAFRNITLWIHLFIFYGYITTAGEEVKLLFMDVVNVCGDSGGGVRHRIYSG